MKKSIKKDPAKEKKREELLKLYESSIKLLAEGEVTTGTVVKVTPSDVIVDVGLKSEGIVSRSEFKEEVAEGDEIRVGNQTARVLFIPSHTTGHVAYVFDDAKATFTGDMLFAAGCGRLFEGNAQMMYDALCVKLAALPNDYLVYCGHEYTEGNLKFALTIEPENGEIKERYEQVRAIRANAASDWHDATPAEMTVPSTMAEERAMNPFMRAEDAEDLGRIRAMKDNF